MSSNISTLPPEECGYHDFGKDAVPIVVFLTMTCIVGTIGNIHVFLVYLLRYKSSVYKTFVLCLTAADFVGCAFCIPSALALYILRHPSVLSSSGFCKFSVTVTYIIEAYSLVLLVVIAVERYRKVCQGTRSQFTLRKARMVCASTFVVMFIFYVIPIPIVYGVNTAKPSSIHHACAVLDRYENSTFTNMYLSTAIGIFMLYFVISLVLYGLIGKTIYLHQSKCNDDSRESSSSTRIERAMASMDNSQDTMSLKRKCSSNNSFALNKAVPIIIDEASEDVGMVTTSCLGKDIPRDDNDLTCKHVPSNKDGRRASKVDRRRTQTNVLKAGRNKTMVFMVVSIVSFAGYLPFLVATLVWNVDSSGFEYLATNHGIVHLLIRWMFFLNNAVNPIVYGFLDRKFRRELINMYYQLKRLLFRR